MTSGRTSRTAAITASRIGHVEFATPKTHGLELIVADGTRVRLKRRVAAQRRDATKHVHQIDPDLSGRAGDEHAGSTHR
jgi:hypothetical protein